MKRKWFKWVLLGIVFLIGIVTIGRLVYFSAPSDAVTIDEMFDTFENNMRVFNDFKATAWHPGYLTVEFNGKEYHLIDQSRRSRIDRKYGETSWVTNAFYYSPYFDGSRGEKQTEPLLSKLFWDGSVSKIGVEYYAILDTAGSSQRMVIIPKDAVLNVVDASTWNNTHATLSGAYYPEYSFYFVFNMTTHEMAVFRFAKAVDENGKEFYWLEHDFGPIWGNITVVDGEAFTCGGNYYEFEDFQVGCILLINEK